MLSNQQAKDDLPQLYQHRFAAADRERKNALWKVLCREFLQRYVGETDTVVDLGAGYGEFINNIRCGRKFAVDLNTDTAGALDADVTFLERTSSNLAGIDHAAVDVVFASNFFEHLPTKDELLATLQEIGRVLTPGGRLLVLQPNIRYAFREYWDFLDHYLPLSHVSLSEALDLTGFTVRECRPRFLPFTTKSKLPQSPALLRLYLRLTPLQWLLGRQMFVVAVNGARAADGPAR
jgi:SAM-dependent methyltransferase